MMELSEHFDAIDAALCERAAARPTGLFVHGTDVCFWNEWRDELKRVRRALSVDPTEEDTPDV